MATIQDAFSNEDEIRDLEGSEVTGGILQNKQFDGGTWLEFDGVNDYITVPDDASLPTTDFTFQGWFYWNDLSVTNQVASHWLTSGNQRSWAIRTSTVVTNGIDFFTSNNGSAAKTLRSDANVLEEGKWTHIAIVKNDTVGSFYVNGQLVGDDGTAIDATLKNSTNDLSIGILGDLSTSPMNGFISNVALFDDVRTEAEIHSDYINGSVDVAAGNLLFYFRLDEGTGTAADNAEGTAALDGTISGATWKTTETDLFAKKSRTISEDIVSGLSATAINSFAYTTEDLPGGTQGRAQFTNDYETGREDVLSFDGASGDVDCGSDSSLDSMLNGGGSIAAWIYPKGGGENSFGYIASKINLGSQTGWNVSVSDLDGGFVSLQFYNYRATAAGFWDSNVVIPVDAWTHICITIDIDTTTDPLMYVNGQTVAINEKSTPSGASTSDAGNNLLIGNEPGDARTFDGYIAEAVVYDDTLTAAEVLTIYQGTAADHTGNQQGYWKLDEGTGTSAADSSANTNTGTITGASWDTEYDLASIHATWKNSNNDTLYSGIPGAYSFDGVDDEVTFGSDTSIDNTFSASPNTGTLMAWIFTRGYSGSGSSRLLDKRALSSSGWGLAQKTTGELQFFHDWSGATGTWETDQIVPLNKWTHVAMVYTGSGTGQDPTFYIDGIEVDSTETATPSGTINNDGANTLAAGAYSGGSQVHDGLMKDIRLYDAILSASDIKDYVYDSVEPSTTNLQLHARLDGNALDETSNNNDGTVTGALLRPGFTYEVARGDLLSSDTNVLSFDGVNDLVNCGSDASLDNIFQGGSQTGTYQAWVYLRAYGANIQRIIDKRGGGSGPTFMLQASTGLLLFYHDHSTTDGSWQAADSIPLNKWVHVAVTYDGSSISNDPIFFIDSQVSPTTESIAPAGSIVGDGGSDLYIGNQSTTTRPWDGYIANVAIFDDIRTASEIHTDYLNGYVDTAAGNLVGLWYFNEGTGTSITDHSSNTNTGTVTGATWTDDYKRPTPADPTQTTISLSSLSFTDAVYYRAFFDNNNPLSTYSLTEITIDYDAGAVAALLNLRLLGVGR